MNAYMLSVALSGDHKKKQSYILTQKGSTFLLPFHKIEYPKFFHKEIQNIVINFFQNQTVKLAEEVSFNYLSINHRNAIPFVKKYYDDFNEETDLIIIYGGILLNYPTVEDYQWTTYVTNTKYQGFSPDADLNLLLDYVIKKSTL